jgi:hypothetical protein
MLIEIREQIGRHDRLILEVLVIVVQQRKPLAIIIDYAAQSAVLIAPIAGRERRSG